LKVVNAAASPKEVRINLAGAKTVNSRGKAYVLASADPKSENSFESPTNVSPLERQVKAAREFNYTLAPNSLTVLRIGSAAK
jgi:alpha-N-arabinofuranosidase